MTVNRLFGLLASFLLAAAATFAVTANVYWDTNHPGRIVMALLVCILIHGLRYFRLWLSREIFLSLAFLGYSLLSLTWTADMHTATPTLPSLFTFTLVLILFSALVAYHDLKAILAGMLAGSLAAAVLYTMISGYPFSYPEDFSYNTIAGLYLSGLAITLLFGAYAGLRVLPVALGTVLLTLIATTTSIKTNLGVAIGFIGAGVLYFNLTIKQAIRDVVVLAIFAGCVAYGVSSNQALIDRVQSGYARVSTGVAVLTNRESDAGNIGLETREGWKSAGLKGWYTNPVFGYGVEAFRADFGITSHSTPIDLLYNSGLIGCSLFYSLSASIAWRLLKARNPNRRGLRGRIAMFVIAYGFISLSGLQYYDTFLAIFLSLGSGLLVRTERSAAPESPPLERLIGNAGANPA
jgi:O-antigen ligase